jgi:ELWxxDGT repeat protein
MKGILLSLLSLVSLPAFGLEPYLVKDINPVAVPDGSWPSDFVSLGQAAVFTAFDGESGIWLWRSDGTAAGTWKLAEIEPGPASVTTWALAVVEGRAFLSFGSDVWVTDGTVAGTVRLTDNLLGVPLFEDTAWVPEQRALYFFATDRAHGTELWRTDGTRAGTYLVADLVRGPQSPYVSRLKAFRGQVWFDAWNASIGGFLWRSDGTERGTVPVLESSRSDRPLRFHGVVGKRLLVSGAMDGKGAQLWATDGTPEGTRSLLRVKGFFPFDSVVQNGRLFFEAVNPGHGQELWVSDGTVRGTRVISDIPGKEAFDNNHNGYRLPLPRTSLPGRFLFRAWDPEHGVEVWATDGTPEGTRLVRDVCPGPCHGAQGDPLISQGLFYFAGNDGVHGEEMWVSDGGSTGSAGTRMVRDVCPGSCGSVNMQPSRFGGRLVFAGYDLVNGEELWATDGTEAGTVRLTDFVLSNALGFFQGTGTAGGPARLLFAAADGEHGAELWSTDGTPGGETLVADLNHADFGGSVISGIRALGDQAVFFADDGLRGYELWKSDGTAAGTSLVAELRPGSEPLEPPEVLASAEAAGVLYLLLEEGDEVSLWRTDGTAAGTIRLRGPDDRPGLLRGSELAAAGGTAFFTVYDEALGLQLWASDGTVAGTREVLKVGEDLGEDPDTWRGLAELGGRLYFFSTVPDSSGFWRSDGTASGTVRINNLYAGYRPLRAVHAGRLWFLAAEPGGVDRLWSSDGTASGTRIEPLPGIPRYPAFLASAGANLMIAGVSEIGTLDLWATDGTPEGTRKVGPAPYGFSSTGWTVFQGRLVYSVDESLDADPELWISDGTPAGTGPLRDRDGRPIPAPLAFAVLGDGGDRLIFTTEDPPRVWESDGTSAGTVPIAPMRLIGSSPGAVGRAGNRVFFGAWEPATGQELWAVEEGHP